MKSWSSYYNSLMRTSFLGGENIQKTAAPEGGGVKRLGLRFSPQVVGAGYSTSMDISSTGMRTSMVTGT